MGLTKRQQYHPLPHGKIPDRRADSGGYEFCSVSVVGSCIDGEWKGFFSSSVIERKLAMAPERGTREVFKKSTNKRAVEGRTRG